MTSPVCGANMNNRLIGPMPAFCPMIFLLMTNDTTYRGKEKQWPPRRKTINKNQEYLYHIFNRVAIPKELVLPMFPSTSLNLEKEETQNSHFHWSLQADIWETNVVRIHTFCCLLSEVLRRFSCRILGVSSVQPGNFVPCGSPTVEEVKLSFYPSRCFWLVY